MAIHRRLLSIDSPPRVCCRQTAFKLTLEPVPADYKSGRDPRGFPLSRSRSSVVLHVTPTFLLTHVKLLRLAGLVVDVNVKRSGLYGVQVQIL